MNKPRKQELNVLILEDDVYDAELVHHELRKGGLAFRLTRVETREAFRNALRRDRPDVILSDHGLPSFDGFEAQAIARLECPEVPFIFVTGLSDDTAATAAFQHSGAAYVLKSRLSGLLPLVRNAIAKPAGKRVSWAPGDDGESHATSP